MNDECMMMLALVPFTFPISFQNHQIDTKERKISKPRHFIKQIPSQNTFVRLDLDILILMKKLSTKLLFIISNSSIVSEFLLSLKCIANHPRFYTVGVLS